MSTNDQIENLNRETRKNAEFRQSIYALAAALEDTAGDLLKGLDSVPEKVKGDAYRRFETDLRSPLEFIARNAKRVAMERIQRFEGLADACVSPARTRVAQHGWETANAQYGRVAERMKLGINEDIHALLTKGVTDLKKVIDHTSFEVRKDSLEDALLAALKLADHQMKTGVGLATEMIEAALNLWKGLTRAFAQAANKAARAMKPLEVVRDQLSTAMITLYRIPTTPEREQIPPEGLNPHTRALAEFTEAVKAWSETRGLQQDESDDPIETAALMDSASHLGAQEVSALVKRKGSRMR